MIMLPDHPLFYQYLHSALPPCFNQSLSSDFSGVFAVRHDSFCLEPLTDAELDEYMFGGEYDEFDKIDGWSDDH